MKRLALALTAAIVLVCSQASASPPPTVDVSDIWWNPNESGWGMQLVESDGFVFATLFVYDTQSLPTWYTGDLDNNTGFLSWSGGLYATTGPYFGTVPFDPKLVTASQVGTMTIALTTPEQGTLTYTVNGVSVTKSIIRQTLQAVDPSGTYSGINNQVQTCGTSGAGSALLHNIPQTATITQPDAAGNVTVTITAPNAGGYCTQVGTYTQQGKVGLIQGTVTCTDPPQTGTFVFSEIYVTPSAISFNEAFDVNICPSITGQWTGLRQP